MYSRLEDDCFVIAGSGTFLIEPPRPGDRLTRRSPSEGIEYTGIVVSEAPETAEALLGRGIPVESAGAGMYVETLEIEPGSSRTRTIGRRLTDSSGRVPRGQSLGRPSWNEPPAEPTAGGSAVPTAPAGQPYGWTAPPGPYGATPQTGAYAGLPPADPYGQMPPAGPYSAAPPTDPYANLPGYEYGYMPTPGPPAGMPGPSAPSGNAWGYEYGYLPPAPPPQPGRARESIDFSREEMPDYAEDKPTKAELDTAGQVVWEIIRIVNRQYSVQDADPDRWKNTQPWFPRYKPLLKEWFLLTYGVEIPKGRKRLQGKDLRDRLEAAFQKTQPLLDVLHQSGGAQWTKQLRKFFYPRVADLDLEVAKTMPRPVIIVPFEFTERPKPVTEDIYLHVTARQKSRPFLLQRGIGGFGLGEAKAGMVFSTSQQDSREVLWSNGFGVFYAQDGVIYAQLAQGFSEDIIMRAFTIAGQNAAGSAIMAQIMVETALSFTPWGFVADGVFALRALTEGDWKGAGLQLLPGLGGKGLGILSKTRAGKRVVRFAKATAAITANFLKGTVRFFARGAYKFRGKWIRGVWAVEETAGKQTYRFFDEAEQVWREAADGPTYIKCSWCKYTGTGQAAALQGAVDEIVEDLLHSPVYSTSGKLLVNPDLIRDVLKAYGPQGDHVVEMIVQTWERVPKKEAVQLFEDTMRIAKTLSPLRGAVEVFEDLASSSVNTARGTMYELQWMERHVNQIRELGVPVARGNWVGKGVDVVLKNNEHIELKSFQWFKEVYQKNPERAMSGLVRQVLSRLEYPDVVRVTVVFDSSYKMPAAFQQALQDIKAAIQEFNPRAEVNFVTWP